MFGCLNGVRPLRLFCVLYCFWSFGWSVGRSVECNGKSHHRAYSYYRFGHFVFCPAALLLLLHCRGIAMNRESNEYASRAKKTVRCRFGLCVRALATRTSLCGRNCNFETDETKKSRIREELNLLLERRYPFDVARCGTASSASCSRPNKIASNKRGRYFAIAESPRHWLRRLFYQFACEWEINVGADPVTVQLSSGGACMRYRVSSERKYCSSREKEMYKFPVWCKIDVYRHIWFTVYINIVCSLFPIYTFFVPLLVPYWSSLAAHNIIVYRILFFCFQQEDKYELIARILTNKNRYFH